MSYVPSSLLNVGTTLKTWKERKKNQEKKTCFMGKIQAALCFPLVRKIIEK